MCKEASQMDEASVDKGALLARIDRELESWDRFVRQIPRDCMEIAGCDGSWSFKDVVGHLMAWRRLTIAKLESAIHNGEPPSNPWPAELDESGDVDAINDLFFQQSRDRPLDEVLDEYRDSFHQIRAAAQALSPEVLFDPTRFAWLRGESIGQDVIGGSFDHLHQEHATRLQEWIDSLPS